MLLILKMLNKQLSVVHIIVAMFCLKNLFRYLFRLTYGSWMAHLVGNKNVCIIQSVLYDKHFRKYLWLCVNPNRDMIIFTLFIHLLIISEFQQKKGTWEFILKVEKRSIFQNNEGKVYLKKWVKNWHSYSTFTMMFVWEKSLFTGVPWILSN